MDRYTRSRDRIVKQLKTIKSFTDSIDETTTLEAIQAREESCKKIYTDFNDCELELLAFDQYTPITTQVDDMYLNTIATLRKEINCRSQVKTEVLDLNATLGQFIGQQQSVLEGMNHTQNVRLPKVNIEPFAGDYKLWPSFHDLFTTSVHENKGLSAVHKLQILNGLLRGDAATLIRHIKVTEQNYAEAWAKLVARYNKPKSIIYSLIQLLLDLKGCTQPNHKDLRKLGDTSDEVIRGLRALGNQAETRDPWLVHILVGKVDPDTRQLWAKETVNNAYPTFENFLSFLSTRCDALESCVAVTKPTNTIVKHGKIFHTTQTSKWNYACVACKQDHFLYKCPLFKSMDVENRTKILQNSNSCTNCLRSGHSEPQCFSRAVCLICKKRHHSLLHKDMKSTNLHVLNENIESPIPNIVSPINNIVSAINNGSPTTTSSSTAQNYQQLTNDQNHQSTLSSQSSTKNLQSTSLHTETPLNTLLPTALIYIQSSNGQQMQARVLLDSESQSSFITESCVQRLGLKRQYSHMSIYGLASCSAGKTRGKTTITITSRVVPHYTINLTTHIIERISSSLPAAMITIPKSNEVWQLDLADPSFNTPNPVDLLIGAEFFMDILNEQKLLIDSLPVLHSSKFGWLIAGKIYQDKEAHSIRNYNAVMNSNNSNDNLMELLKRFWEVEELAVTSSNREDDPCEILFRDTTTRAPDGRFIVRLPFKEPRPKLGDSLASAKARMFGIERKFSKSADYQKNYHQFIEEYIELGQMIPQSWSEVERENNMKYFMPHHAVFKKSTTTKFRVVFDASCKTTTAMSLNDCLHAGPKLQPDLTTTLIQFRKNIVAINADIEKMFRQILVDPDDANYQYILWRKSVQEELRPHKCITVTYGTTCAPFLAIRSLEELAKNYETQYPEAARAIRNHFYMDDLLTGSNTVEGAIILKDQIMEILSSCGFRLRKWKSNSQEFLHSLEVHSGEDIPKLIEDDTSTKTLGIMWYPQRDIFTFEIKNLTKDVIWTKRRMLSESSKLYDPLGWVSPIIIRFKIILQKLWLTKTDWDEEAPDSILSHWKKIYFDLIHLQHIQIPRCLLPLPNSSSVQLHAFCDASESAYGGVIYVRSSNNNGEITCRLLCAKSKVAPIKQISLPRLELCGAVLLSNLIKYCKSTLDIDNVDIYAWTDSMVVLHWLSDIPARWKTFIANRTSTILGIVPRDKWSHVASNQNPADYIYIERGRSKAYF